MTWNSRFEFGLLNIAGIMVVQGKLAPDSATSLPTRGRRNNAPFAQDIHSQIPEDYDYVISHSKGGLR